MTNPFGGKLKLVKIETLKKITQIIKKERKLEKEQD